jgi:AhpD family alkylhydroperoxidase
MQFHAERLPNADMRTVGQAMRAMLGLEGFVAESGLEQPLLELVRTRVSQINGCAYCLDMHTKDARAHGEDEQRLHLLAAWREAPIYSERERAALAWAEALTLLAEDRVPDAAFAEVRPVFSDDELVALTMAIVAINGWNRFNVGFRTVPGGYQPDANPRSAVLAGG